MHLEAEKRTRAEFQLHLSMLLCEQSQILSYTAKMSPFWPHPAGLAFILCQVSMCKGPFAAKIAAVGQMNLQKEYLIYEELLTVRIDLYKSAPNYLGLIADSRPECSALHVVLCSVLIQAYPQAISMNSKIKKRE